MAIRPTALTLAEAAPMMPLAKDKCIERRRLAYLSGGTCGGSDEWGAGFNPLSRDYEAILARMSLTLADQDPLEVTVDDLRDVIDLWADREARTRADSDFRCSGVLVVGRGTGSGSVLPGSEAGVAPRKAPPCRTRMRLLAPPKYRDRVELLLLVLGPAGGGLAGVAAYIDLAVAGAVLGKESRVIPLRGRRGRRSSIARNASLLDRGSEPGPDYLLYPGEAKRRWNADRRYLKEAHQCPDVSRTARWNRHEDAEVIVEQGMTSGLNMHPRARTFATDLRGSADLGATSQALGHSDLSTTASIYGHYDLSDLERAMEALARSRRKEDEEPAD